jgi:Zn-dependent M16 (insulinase) family peptidase
MSDQRCAMRQEKEPTMRRWLYLLLIPMFITVMIFPAAAGVVLEDLQSEQIIHGFSVANLYVNGADRVMGARFISQRYGFIVDLMQIQSVPQGFIWIKTPPGSDQGLPHTCEHLLLGKGNRGRYVSALEQMSLGSSTAYTGQVRTCYHFNTIAGEETFYEILEAKLLAFLQPDFTDEEIRREVCHVGVTTEQQTGDLALEEKGTVYTEMVSSFEKPWYYYYNTMREMLYGRGHPLVNVAGGTPSALRTVTAADFWEFHEKTHHLANMGFIASIPHEMAVDSFLSRLGTILQRCQPEPRKSQHVGIGRYPLPAPASAPPGTIRLVTYPSDNDQDPGTIHFCWPPHLELDNRQSILLDLFLTAFGDGSTSNLYDLFINSQTRVIDLGGNNIWTWAPDYQGHPIWIAMEGIDNVCITEQMVDSVRTLIIGEIQRIYGLADGSQDLLDFNREVRSHLVQMRKDQEDYLNSPPMFGFRRGTAGGWEDNLEFLEKDAGFRKSLVYKEHFDHAEELLASGANIWRELIDRCRLLEVPPYAVGSTPDAAMIARMEEEKEKRIAGYAEDFQRTYGSESAAEAIARYKDEFDRNTARLEQISADQQLPGFIDHPPLTLDDPLKYETITLSGRVPLVASTFESMSSATVGIALRLDVVPESLLVYVPFLPDALTSIGVFEDDGAVTYDLMQERLRQEVLRLDARFDHGFQTGRTELVLTGAGSDLAELRNAIGWMNSCLYQPYLSVDNLARMTDIVDQTLISLRNTMKRSEEAWVRNPANAYRFQTDPLLLSTYSFLTRTHQFHRLRFLLSDPGTGADLEDVQGFLQRLAGWGRGRERQEMTALLDAIIDQEEGGSPGRRDLDLRLEDLTDRARSNAKLAARALQACLAEIPDENLSDDWSYLCAQIGQDLAVAPQQAVANLRALLDLICARENARLFMISNSPDRSAVLDQIADLADGLNGRTVPARQSYAAAPGITERLKSRHSDLDGPVYVGLLHEGTRNGVIIHTSRYASEYDTSAASVLNCLAGKLYSGGGGHGLFMRTWGAGLAYSNGISVNGATGRVGYYAERCPDVAETMRFVVGVLQEAEEDPDLVDYTIAQIFGRSRAAQRYEARGEAMAADLADGYLPSRVAAFRSRILSARDREGLSGELAGRMEKIYGKVLIGYGDPLASAADGYFFLIGPETQFTSMENYIAGTEGAQTVHRLYPRDFWLTAELSN